jgi:hypothetical protein
VSSRKSQTNHLVHYILSKSSLARSVAVHSEVAPDPRAACALAPPTSSRPMKFQVPHSLSGAHGSLNLITSLLELRFVVISIHCACGRQPNLEPRLKHPRELVCFIVQIQLIRFFLSTSSAWQGCKSGIRPLVRSPRTTPFSMPSRGLLILRMKV